MLFFTADWHIGETRLELMQRPFSGPAQMLEALLYHHNLCVSPTDRVIIVGDIVYKETPDWLKYVKKFNGKKTLIRGNHDRVFTDEDLSPYFEEIVEEGSGLEFEIEGIPCYATHYPTKSAPNAFNLVGHIHSAWKYQLNMYNVGVDANHFYPVTTAKIAEAFKAIHDYYDDDVWSAYSAANMIYLGKRGKMGSYLKG
jgi:calcineurin-like phosphoesterase family protein